MISRLERKGFPNGRKGLSRFKRNQFPDGAEYAGIDIIEQCTLIDTDFAD